ncbi:protein of unknown function [Rhodovastum atsumiense]|nr:protein of unknown function [Rhodovastum atsumiense]
MTINPGIEAEVWLEPRMLNRMVLRNSIASDDSQKDWTILIELQMLPIRSECDGTDCGQQSSS